LHFTPTVVVVVVDAVTVVVTVVRVDVDVMDGHVLHVTGQLSLICTKSPKAELQN
jgi:hypothetical protein